MPKFIGYAPDLPPTTPGVMTDCAALIPSSRGYKPAATPASVGLPALTGTLPACRGAALVRKTDDTTRLFAGTVNGLFESGSATWTPRSSGVYALGSTNKWRFAQFGDRSLAAAKTEILQSLTTATTFANVTSTAPKGAIVETVNNFVMLLNVNDQGAIFDSADRPDGWWCGPKGNDGTGNWVPSVTTEAATGTLRSTPGPITAGRRFGNQMVAYKLRSMYLGTYVGPPVIWDWQLLPGEAGAMSQEAVANIGAADDPKHIFMGFDNFYMFAGGRAVSIGNVTEEGFMSPVRDTVFAELNASAYYACQALHDPRKALVYFYYPTINSITPDKCVVYNYRTNRWGRDDRTIEQVVDFIAAGTSYNDLGTSFSTYNDLPAQSYDVAFALQGAQLPAIFDTTHTLKTLTGTPTNSSITTGDYGDPQQFFDLVRVIPQFLTAPTSATMTNYSRDILSDVLTPRGATAMSSGRFDVLASARWHRAKFDMTGDYEITGFDAQSSEDGEE
jgi:hypothetical protein